VAYYCRQYAVMTGISLPNSTPGAKACLSAILNDLEVEKGPMSNFTKEEAEVITRGFAANVFDKADEVDRAGLADKSTARTFYASAVFYDVLQQFTKKDDAEEEGTDAFEDQQKRVYAKWKATEILKAIKEGRAVTPGGYGETQEEEEKEKEDMGIPPPAPVNAPIVEDEDSEEMVIPPPPLAPPSFNEAMANSQTHNHHQGSAQEEEGGVEDQSNVEVTLGPPPSYPGDGEINIITPSSPTHTSTTSASADGGPPALETSHSTIMARKPQPKPANNYSSWFGNSSSSSKNSKSKRISKEAMEDAIELTKFALAALETNDADMASNRLEQALQFLGRR